MLSSSALATVWQHRGLLRALTVRDIQNRYAGSVAGVVWALLNPLVMLAIYGVVFEFVFRVSVPNLNAHQPYVLFVATALWPWLAFQEALMRGTLAVSNHAALVKKVAFPHELLIYSAVLASFAIHGCGFLMVLVTLWLLGFDISFWSMPVVLMALLLLGIFAAALALLLGALQVFVRDVEQLLAQVLSVLFYATPILYAMSAVPAWLGSVMLWNPLVHLLSPIRMAVLHLEPVNWIGMGGMVAATVGVFYLSRRFFQKLSPHFEDMV